MTRPVNRSRDEPLPRREPPGTTVELLLAGSELTRVLERMLRRRADLSLVEFNALRVLGAREPETAQPSDLTRALRMSSAHATSVLHRLEERGLVERAANPGDRRRRLVRLTPTGRAALEAALPALDELDERMGALLGSRDAASALWVTLRQVRLALREALAADDLDCVGP